MTQVSNLVVHRVWELIVPAARTGRPPPSISAMACMLRRSGHTVRAALATLEDRGMIRRETVSGIGQRIYVVSLGQWTGWTGSRVRESAKPTEDPDAYLAAAMRGRRYEDHAAAARPEIGRRISGVVPGFVPTRAPSGMAAA